MANHAAKASEFLITLADLSQFPGLFHGQFLKGHRQPRIAMVGRSNVGKSSFINALLKAQLAQTSNQPGKTRAIHFYLWNEGRKIIADLPGYGYARAGKMDRNKWEELIGTYFNHDGNLERVILLLDARHGPTEGDHQAIDFLRMQDISVTVVFSKADLLKTQSERALRKREATTALDKLGIVRESVFWVSNRTQDGLRQLSDYLKKDLEGSQEAEMESENGG